MSERQKPNHMRPVFEAKPKPITSLLSRIDEGVIALPEFQREFVWETARTKNLIATILSRYPAGTLLMLELEGKSNSVFKPREFESAPPLVDRKPSLLVLDGQQRLTSLYQVLYGAGEYEYFIDLRFLLNSSIKVQKEKKRKGKNVEYFTHLFNVSPILINDETDVMEDPEKINWDQAIIAKQIEKDKIGEPLSEYKAKDRTYEQIWFFPLVECLIAGKTSTWIRTLAKKLNENLNGNEDSRDAWEEKLTKIDLFYLSFLSTYSFPVLELDGSTSLLAVCKIFEGLNTNQKQLSVYDLLTARFYSDEVNLHDLWEQSIKKYDNLEKYGVDPYSVLQALSIRVGGTAQRQDVVTKLTANQIRDHWDSIIFGFDGAARLLSGEGIFSGKWLSYPMTLVPMAAVWNIYEEAKGPEKGVIRDKLAKYYWCSSFQGNFDNGANSQADRDAEALKGWLKNKPSSEPEAIAGWDFDIKKLREAKTNRSALYKAIIALTILSGAKDFYKRQNLTEAVLDNKTEDVDSHHVFPSEWFKTDGKGAGEKELILNRVLINDRTNQSIGKNPPNRYLAKIQTELEESLGSSSAEASLDETLTSHLLPLPSAGCYTADNYQMFIEMRSEIVASKIEEVTGKKMSTQT